MSTTRGIAVTALGNLVPPLTALATQPILARALDVSGRGEVAAVTAPLLLAVVVLGLGLPESLTFFVARRALRPSMSWFGVVSLCLAGFLGMLAVACLSNSLSAGDDELARLMIIASSALVPALLVAAMRGVAAGRQRWGLIAVERSASAFIRLLAIAVLAGTGELTVFTATIAISTTTFLGGLLYLPVAVVFWRECRLTSAGDATGVPKFGIYAAQIWLGATAGVVFSRLDQLLMTPLAGVYQLGLYAVAASIAEVILLSNLAIRDVIFSVESGAPDTERAGRAARVSMLVTLMMGIPLAAAAPWAIPTLFGDAFADAAVVTVILILAAIIGTPGSVAGAVLSGRGRPGLRSLSLGIGLFVNLALVLVLVPAHGAVGAAVATLLTNLIAGNNLNVLWLRVFFSVPMSQSFLIRRADLTYLAQVPRQLTRGSAHV